MKALHYLGFEYRYSFDIACYWLQKCRPASLRIYSDDVEFVQAVARRVSWLEGTLIVEHPSLVQAIEGMVDIRAVAYEPGMVSEGAIVPFSSDQFAAPPDANYLVTMGFNALSYKSLLYPGTVHGNIIQLLRWVRQKYRVDARFGLCSPRWLLPWLVAMLAGTRFPYVHFRTEQIAMNHLIANNWLWATGYIVVIGGTRHNLSEQPA